MPVPTIFLIGDDNQIIEMKDQPYESEDLLQQLLAKCPSVLAGDQFSGSAPLKWLFIAREAGIPGEQGGTDRWSLDHIFVDQNGVPTFVEVKRSSDTRIRREVVGQMLDYAANAVLYWPVETIRQRFEETCREAGSEPDMIVAEFIGISTSGEHESAVARFWETVETNLRAGKIRLVFAADEIPPELKRVVEFLNEQMNPAEVLGIEIRQYVGTGVRTLVPSVIRSSKRIGTSGSSAPRTSIQWDRDSFIERLRERRGQEAVDVATALLAWASSHCPTIWWGEGRKDGSCFMGISHEGVNIYPFSIWTSGWVQLQGQLLQRRGVPVELLEKWRTDLNGIPGVSITQDALTRFPSFQSTLLKDPNALSKFLISVEALVEQIRTTAGPKSEAAVAK
jgi:hypothetical protein